MKSTRRSTRMLSVAALLAACLLLVPAPTLGQRPKLSSLLKGAVTFTLPEGWPVYMYTDADTDGAVELRDFYPEAPEGKLPAQGFMTAKIEPEYNTVKEASDPQQPHPGETVLIDTFDGTEWRTRVRREMRFDKPYLAFGRVGLVNHKLVGLTIFLPPGRVDPETVRRVVADFNAMCESLKIEGQNRFDNKVSADELLERLKADEK